MINEASLDQQRYLHHPIRRWAVPAERRKHKQTTNVDPVSPGYVAMLKSEFEV
jgi:hypothetical protein